MSLVCGHEIHMNVSSVREDMKCMNVSSVREDMKYMNVSLHKDQYFDNVAITLNLLTIS